MILSAGSLVSQNILDAVEPRRRELRVVGLNLDADNPRLFRCDEVWLVPPVESEAEMESRLLELEATERPDLIVPGRDHDVDFLAGILERHPRLARCIPCGSRDVAIMMQDKYRSYEFARERGLSFADTLLVSADTQRESILRWMRHHPFPLLVKPRSGYGSHGIRLVLTHDQLCRIIPTTDCVLQEYAGPDRDLQALSDLGTTGVPWFFSVEETAQYAGQTVIGPDGHAGPVFCSVNTMVMGRCEASQACADPVLAQLAQAYAEAVAGLGWRGSFNVQFQRNSRGEYKAHEMNGRMTGSTSARRLMGYDEISLLFALFPGKQLRSIPAPLAGRQGRVLRTLTDQYLLTTDVDCLANQAHWTRRQASTEIEM
jgi:carbamoyl-phosphate synthase large subunit